jgi:hypothetical protein
VSAKIQRREFITLLGGAAAAWPLAARARRLKKKKPGVAAGPLLGGLSDARTSNHPLRRFLKAFDAISIR